MKVTVVSRIYLPEPSAASYRLGALVTALRSDGDDVTVVTTKPARSDRHDDGHVDLAGGDGTKVGSLRIKRWPVLRDRSGYVRGYLPYLSFDVPVFFRVLFARRPGVLVVEPPPTTGGAIRLACAIRRIPYVYYGADIWSDASATTGAPGWVVATLRRLERWVWRGAHSVLSVSAGVTHRMAQIAPGLRVDEVNNGIDVSRFTITDEARSAQTQSEEAAPGDSAAAANQSVSDEPTDAQLQVGEYFIYAGTASEWHGAEVFAKAMRFVHEADPSLRLIYLGHGALTAQIKQSCADLPADLVQFLPRASARDTASWLRHAVAAVASVAPGSGYDFAFPSKALAAAACGTPVVYAGAAAAGEVITAAGLGKAVPLDAREVAAAMLATVQDERHHRDDETRRQLRRQWVVDNASLETVAERAVAAIRRVAATPKEPGS